MRRNLKNKKKEIHSLIVLIIFFFKLPFFLLHQEMEKGQTYWESVCWNGGVEWVLNQVYWKRMWEGKTKAVRIKTSDSDRISVRPAVMICDSRREGFALLNVLSHASKEKLESPYDLEIYCIAWNKLQEDRKTRVDKVRIVREIVEEIGGNYPGKRVITRVKKRSLVRMLVANGFKEAGGVLSAEMPKGRKRKRITLDNIRPLDF